MMHITVCICTFKRPVLLKRLLIALDCQVTHDAFSYSIIVTDNDQARSAESVVQEFLPSASIPIDYVSEPRQNIALARNKALAASTGDFVAFIDDDETPIDEWLYHLLKVCIRTDAAGVLGPVRPIFEHAPPSWVIKGRFFDRPRHETGYKVTLSDARTGNVLLRRQIFDGGGEVFRQQFGTGGEDVDFYQRMMAKGHVFVWCDEAAVYELVPETRCSRIYLVKRALLRGQNTSRQDSGRILKIGTSLVAAPLYVFALPITFILGEHHFLKYLIKLCDHLGRLLGFMRVNPISVRQT